MTDLTISQLVDDLLTRHMRMEIADAVRDDGRYPELAQTCAGLSGGEAGTLSMVFGEVSDILDADAATREGIVDAESPAAALADLVRTHHAGMRIVT